jgi:hypothetical protein
MTQMQKRRNGAVIGYVLENEPMLKLLKSRHREMRIIGKEIHIATRGY